MVDYGLDDGEHRRTSGKGKEKGVDGEYTDANAASSTEDEALSGEETDFEERPRATVKSRLI